MSGFVGLWQRGGRPVEPALLAALTDSLRFRGPDAAGTWHRGAIGLGHARFVTHAQRNGEPQPLARDGRYWIVGDIRLDAREELIAALTPFAPSSTERVSRGASDAELVLYAYRAWGTDCVARIHGDFSFAIWDEAAQRLFCARDRFGVRPFFYAAFPDLVLVGNTLECLRRHPRIGATPYEPALADYLVVGNLLETDKTFFADLRRLPPGHTLSQDRDGAPRIERYWSLPVEPELRYRRETDYVEHFAELMSRAVADRTPPGAVTLFLSGGLDSAAIAATLSGKCGAVPSGTRTRALCLGWNNAFPDPEPALARDTAHTLGLELATHEFPDCAPFKGWDTAAGVGPEPEDDFYRANTLDSLGLAARRSRVALYGRGGDEILARETLMDELRRGAGPRAMIDAGATWVRAGRRPPLGLRSAKSSARLSWVRVPSWLAPGWIEPLRMDERLRSLAPGPPGPRSHARYRLGSARWTGGFEFGDPGCTGVAVDCRYPFMDERVVSFALRLPPLRWCADKLLLRRALVRLLPATARRPKSLLAGEPLLAWTGQNPQWTRSLRGDAGALAGRIGIAAWQRAWDEQLPAAGRGIGLWRLARVSALARWLAASRSARAALRDVA